MQFLQSVHDFPQIIKLGDKIPSFGLHRFRQGLRFTPIEDEGFTLRGDRHELVYKGRRRSHRITILGDNSFEYDCILNKEPDTNVIRLRIEGAEKYDFLRQPDFVENPLLQGSYAVYKKETLLGEGTGKLCHIHRPEIIDARGRRCWGTLSVVGNELRITVPEQWLADAKYPVVVDPVVGTDTVGSQYLVQFFPPDGSWEHLSLQICISVNRFLVPETINGLCTAYMYAYLDENGNAGGYPVLYSDNGNYPLTRKSMNEGFADFTVNQNNPAGWRSSTFMSNGAITSGSYIWFGVLTKLYWETKFDYGSKFYYGDWLDDYKNIIKNLPNSIPNTYPVGDVDWYFDIKLSMYFTYTADYVRTITHGASLTDTRKLAVIYKRLVIQTTGAGTSISKIILFFRQCVMTLHNTMNIRLLSSMLRKMSDTEGIKDTQSKVQTFLRKTIEIAKINMTLNARQFFVKICAIIDRVDGAARIFSSRELYKKIIDFVKTDGFVKRQLSIFLRIITNSIVRSYLINKFLKSKIDVTLKSHIDKEIWVESRIK